jgi:hypothetical protein
MDEQTREGYTLAVVLSRSIGGSISACVEAAAARLSRRAYSSSYTRFSLAPIPPALIIG